MRAIADVPSTLARTQVSREWREASHLRHLPAVRPLRPARHDRRRGGRPRPPGRAPPGPPRPPPPPPPPPADRVLSRGGLVGGERPRGGGRAAGPRRPAALCARRRAD